MSWHAGGGVQLDSLIWQKVVPHLLLIRSWIPGYPYDTGGPGGGGLNGPGWFLSALFLYWILTKPMLQLVRYVRKREMGVSFVAACCAAMLAFGLVPSLYSDWIPNAVKPQHIFIYLLGLYAGMAKETDNHRLNIISAALYAMAVLAASNIPMTNENFPSVLGDTLFVLGLMYVIPVALKTTRYEQKSMVLAPLKLLGDISFEFYLIHMPMITLVSVINHHLLQNALRGSFVCAIALIATFFVAWFYQKVDMRVRRHRMT